MSGHTPGPWIAAAKPSSIVGWPIVAQTGRVIANVNYVQHGPIDPKVPGDDAFNRESRANARLIAAAPDLLEALKGVLRVADRATVEFDAARAALAKAEGTTP